MKKFKLIIRYADYTQTFEYESYSRFAGMVVEYVADANNKLVEYDHNENGLPCMFTFESKWK